METSSDRVQENHETKSAEEIMAEQASKVVRELAGFKQRIRERGNEMGSLLSQLATETETRRAEMESKDMHDEVKTSLNEFYEIAMNEFGLSKGAVDKEIDGMEKLGSDSSWMDQDMGEIKATESLHVGNEVKMSNQDKAQGENRKLYDSSNEIGERGFTAAKGVQELINEAEKRWAHLNDSVVDNDPEPWRNVIAWLQAAREMVSQSAVRTAENGRQDMEMVNGDIGELKRKIDLYIEERWNKAQ